MKTHSAIGEEALEAAADARGTHSSYRVSPIRIAGDIVSGRCESLRQTKAIFSGRDLRHGIGRQVYALRKGWRIRDDILPASVIGEAGRIIFDRRA